MQHNDRTLADGLSGSMLIITLVAWARCTAPSGGADGEVGEEELVSVWEVAKAGGRAGWSGEGGMFSRRRDCRFAGTSY